MKIHEYQAKEILRKYNVAVPNGVLVSKNQRLLKPPKKLAPMLWWSKPRFMQEDEVKAEVSSWQRVRRKPKSMLEIFSA